MFARSFCESSAAGFTFIELLAVAAIAGILISISYSVFLAQKRIYASQEEEVDAQQNARVALEELTRVLAAVGADVDSGQGQVKILAAQPYQITFNANLNTENVSSSLAMDPGEDTPGAASNDPYPKIPPGSYASKTLPAETWRYTLDGDDDGDIDVYDKKKGETYHLFKERTGANDSTGHPTGGVRQELAMMIANPRVGEPLFCYYGRFNSSHYERLRHVDKTTSSKLAGGAALDDLIERIDVTVITETSHDPKYPKNGGYRQTKFETSIVPRNLSIAPPPLSLHQPPPSAFIPCI